MLKASKATFRSKHAQMLQTLGDPAFGGVFCISGCNRPRPGERLVRRPHFNDPSGPPFGVSVLFRPGFRDRTPTRLPVGRSGFRIFRAGYRWSGARIRARWWDRHRLPGVSRPRIFENLNCTQGAGLLLFGQITGGRHVKTCNPRLGPAAMRKPCSGHCRTARRPVQRTDFRPDRGADRPEQADT